ncbi:MAG: aminotransferase class I/II-fold pyridoxal phosphate-dependent enzyme [Patescibacteria group bacterium]
MKIRAKFQQHFESPSRRREETEESMFQQLMDATRGAPPKSLSPAAELAAIAAEAILQGSDELGGYTGGPLGHPGLRNFFATSSGINVDNIFLSPGGMTAWEWYLLYKLAEAEQRGNTWITVGVTRLVYDRALFPSQFFNHLAMTQRVRLVLITEHEDGLDLNELAKVGQQLDILYAVPTFSNPTGATWSEENRRRVLEIAAFYGFTVAEDDPYRGLYYGNNPPPASLFQLAESEALNLVFQMNSQSKLVNFASGRICWSIASSAVVEWLRKAEHPLTPAKRFISQPILGALLLNHLLRDNPDFLEQKAASLRAAFAPVVNELGTLIPARLGEWAQLHAVPQGGYFLWLTLRGGLLAADVIKAAAERSNLKLQAGIGFHADPADPNANRTIRIAFPGIIEAGGAENFVQRMEATFA